MNRMDIIKSYGAGEISKSHLIKSGITDMFRNVFDVFNWDYYIDGENPNRMEYKSLLFNTRVCLNSDDEQPLLDVELFKGDLSRKRILFLMYLSEINDMSFTLIKERDTQRHLIKDGSINTSIKWEGEWLPFKVDIDLYTLVFKEVFQ